MPPPTQNTPPNPQQQLEQFQKMQQQAAAAAAGSTFAGQNGARMQAAQQMGVQQFMINTFIWGKVDLSLASMTSDRIADLVTKASDQVKRSPQWAASNEREKARLMLFHLYKQKVMLDNARRMQGANVTNATGNNQR